MSNPVIRWQILSPDPAVTAAFHEKLFAWSVGRANALGYREIHTGEGGMHGGVWPAPAGATPFVQLFVSVANVEETTAKAARLGAKVIIPPSVLPDGDEIAVVQDPTGLPIGICRLRSPQAGHQ